MRDSPEPVEGAHYRVVECSLKASGLVEPDPDPRHDHTGMVGEYIDYDNCGLNGRRRYRIRLNDAYCLANIIEPAPNEPISVSKG